MANQENAEDGASQESVIEDLQGRSKTQLTVLFGACASTLVLLACLGFTYISLSGQILSATAEPLMEMKNLSGLVGEEYSNLTMAVEFYNHQMSSVEARLDAIDPAVDQEKIQELRAVLISQEQDFQVFLNSAQDAMDGLSKMVSGSRSWRDDFIAKLNLAITTSEARKLALEEASGPAASTPSGSDETAAP
jgi:hypothetical protein